MTQLTLPIAWSQRMDASRLLITPCNAAAFALLRDWANWPSPCTLLVGPRKSARTLMGRLFESESGGMLVDDAETRDEEELFHLWNDARDTGRPMLVIAQNIPPAWPIHLPDLRTRLATAALARVLPPDENVSAALITHGLERAGSAFAPDLPDFVARRVTRYYETVDNVIACLNAESLASGRKLTVASARVALERDGFIAQELPLGMDGGPETSG
jgi:chromosomal replication initiation ATPase DnaA